MVEILFILIIGYVIWVLYPKVSRNHYGLGVELSEDWKTLTVTDNAGIIYVYSSEDAGINDSLIKTYKAGEENNV